MSKLKVDWGKIAEKIKEDETKKFSNSFKKEADPRFFVPNVKDGYAEYRVRLLPSPDTDIPYVKKYSHGFLGHGGWYIEDCPTTIGEKCPVCEDNSRLWKTGEEQDKETSRERSRRLSIITNILIIKDPQNPENEGKVFLFRYGKKIHEKVMSRISPQAGSVDDAVMVFDPENGADFKLKIKKTKFRIRGQEKEAMNYDTSEFATPSALTKEQLKAAENGVYNLSEFVDRKDFKSYDQLRALFEKKSGTKAALTETEIPKERELVSDDPEVASAPIVDDGEGSEDSAFFDKLRKKASK